MNRKVILTTDISDCPPCLRLRKARLSKGLNYMALSELARVPMKQISNFEAGIIATLYASQLSRLARALGMEVEDLFGPDCFRKGEENVQA